jgi:UDP:flavonoid glycosyltransferase YjiC (YdhE family)
MTSVAFVSMLAEGHLRRLLPLVSGVAARGVAAHVLTHGRFVDLFGPYPLEDADPVSFPIAMRSVAYAARYVEDVERELEALRASLVVYDTFAMVGRLAATRMGLPYVNVCAGHNVDPPRFQQILASDPRVSVSRECLEAVERLRARYGVPDASPYSYVDGVSPYLNVYCEPPEYLRGEERAVFEPVAFFGSLPSPEEIAARDRARAPSLFGGDAALRVYVCFGTAVWRSYPSEALAALDAIAEALSRRAPGRRSASGARSPARRRGERSRAPTWPSTTSSISGRRSARPMSSSRTTA